MFKTTLIVTAGILVGAGSVQMLHAQMKPPAYQIAIIDVKDDAGYKQAVADVRKRIGSSSPPVPEVAVVSLPARLAIKPIEWS
jgi:hypothetical protein